MASTTASGKQVPEGYVLHTENTSHILLDANAAFLNPIQEFNRDLSVASIRVWSEEFNREKEAQWRQKIERKQKLKGTGHAAKRMKDNSSESAVHEPETSTPQLHTETPANYQPYRFTILEALSATGLRALRYAKEIPLLKHVIANDLSPAAVEAMHRNVRYNDLGEQKVLKQDGSEKVIPAKVQVNEGDACSLMYSHREEKDRVDVIDLDPYGTAAPFIDGAVQAVKDGGLLCVTCTDLAVLATNNYPEKCFSNYGGVPVKAEYCHEVALRLLLNALSSSAARKTSTIYVCSSCQSFYNQPLGRIFEKKHEKSGHVNHLLKTHQNSIPAKCEECEGALHVAGPMWNGPLHDQAFLEKVLQHVDSNSDHYGTYTRMKGMLTVAKEELDDALFYFVPGKVASHFHCETPSLDEAASALLNAGFKVSRSHASPGSLKTNAGNRDIHDIYRAFIKTHPVKLDKISPSSPAAKLLAKEPRLTTIDFTSHPDSVTAAGKVKVVRYQENPTRNWGPGKRATGKSNTAAAALKRKRPADDETVEADKMT